MKVTKTIIPIGFIFLQILGVVWYVALYDLYPHSHIPINFIVLMLFLAINTGVLFVFSIVYYFYREKKIIWKVPFYVGFLFVGLSLLLDFL